MSSDEFYFITFPLIYEGFFHLHVVEFDDNYSYNILFKKSHFNFFLTTLIILKVIYYIDLIIMKLSSKISKYVILI